MRGEIAEKLRARVTGAEKKKLRKRPPRDSEAYQLYLNGRYHWNKRTRGEPAARHRVLPRGHRVRSVVRQRLRRPRRQLRHARRRTSRCRRARRCRKRRRRRRRPSQIDDELAEAWASLAAVRWWYDWDWARRRRRRTAAPPSSTRTTPTRTTATRCSSPRGAVRRRDRAARTKPRSSIRSR